jgi:sugar lactone lactonase YvrE
MQPLLTEIAPRKRHFLFLAAWLAVSFCGGVSASAQSGAATVAASLGPAAPYFTDDVTAAVTVAAAVAPVPTGTISWDTDSGTQQTVPLVNGVARIELQFFAPGAHTFDYSYSGDSTYAPVASQSLGFTVADRAFTMRGAEYPFFITPPSGTPYSSAFFVSVAVDSKGNFILPDQNSNLLFRVDPRGNASVIPTTGLKGATGLVLDKQDDIFVADTGNGRVVEITAAGAQSVLPIAGLSSPVALAFDPAYQSLYVVDQNAETIVIYNLAAQTQASFSPGISDLTSVAVDAIGDLYYAQGDNQADQGHLYRRDTSGNTLEIFTGVLNIRSLFFDAEGDLFLSGEASSDGLYMLDPLSHLTQLSPTPGQAVIGGRGRIYIANFDAVNVFTPGTSADAGIVYAPDQPDHLDNGELFLNYQAPYQQSFSSISVANGSLFAVPTVNGLPQTGVTSTPIAGVPFLLQAHLDSEPSLPGAFSSPVTVTTTSGATQTNLVYGLGVSQELAVTPGNVAPGSPGVSSVGGVATDGNGNAYVSDPAANQVLKVSSTASSVVPFTGLNAPTQLAVDALGTVFVLDSGSSRILRVDAAANQSVAFDLSAQTALTSLSAFAMDGGDNLYIAGESAAGQAAIDYVDTLGNQFPIAQNIPLPASLALDGFGNLYSVETAGGNLRSYDYSGTPTLVASGLPQPTSVAVDPSGTAFVAGAAAGSGVTIVHPDGTTTPYPSSALVNASAIANDFQGNLVVGDNTGKQMIAIYRAGAANYTGGEYTYDFGTVPQGSTQTYIGTLDNAGNAPTGNYSILPLQQTETSLTADANECVANTTNAPLAAGGYCNLNVLFTATYLGPLSDVYAFADIETGGLNSEISVKLTGNVASAPVPTLTPPALDFGSLAVGTTSTAQGATLGNTGTAALTVSSIAITGANASSFSETNGCGSSVAAGASCIIGVTCTPSATGALTATLAANYPSPLPQQTVALTCNGAAAPAPAAALTPAALSFTAVAGSSSAAQVATLTNSGTAALSIGSIAIAGANASSFAQTNNCGAALAANSACTITVSFTGATAGSYAASLVATDNATPATQSTSLTGTVTAPVAALTPASLSFTTVAGSAPAAQVATLTNSGNAALAISSISIGGANASSFTQASTCGASLAAGANCAISVSFTGTVVGNYSATLTVADNSATATQTAALSGSVTAAPIPLAALAPDSLSFAVVAGSAPAAQMATLTNTGTAALAIGSISIGGANASSFAQTNACGTSLAAGASCAISVNFTGTAVGSYAATLTVADNSATATQTAALSATVTAAPVPVAALAPAALSFTSVAGSVPAVQVATLTNSGNAALAIGSISIGGANASSFTQTNTCGASLAAGANCAISVTFTGTAVGSYAATLTVADNSATPTQTAALSATVTAAPAPAAALAPASLTYSATAGSTSAAQTATLTNSGTAVLNISGITLAGANPTEFSISANTCEVTLAAGASCTISVTFTPEAAGSFSAAISVADDAPGSPQSSALSGTGTAAPTAPDFTVTATPSAQSVAAGGAATYTVSIASTGGSFTDPVALTAVGLFPPGMTVTFSPASVTPGSAGGQSIMTVQTAVQAATQTAGGRGASRWPPAGTLAGAGAITAPVFAAALLLLPGLRSRRRWQARVRRASFSGAGCLLILLGTMAAIAGCGGGFALHQTTPPSSGQTDITYTITVTGTSGSVQHNTTVQLTVR